MICRPHLIALLAAVLVSPVHAQTIADPANLAGEHVSAQSPADTLPLNHGAPALAQLLLKLRTRASMMLIVAHPDDEDGGLLTYESRGQGVRVGMLTLTRGEGGQNLMTADFDGPLGLIRTQELLAADRYMGVDQFFGTEIDFGFSKTKEESFQKWTHDRVLYDAVRAVRLYRPLVVASVFVGGVTDGHGHHQVAGEISQEVFKAAADPSVFPEMIAQGLLPWAPMKVYARVPFARVTEQGMYDYATGKWAPARFFNYVTGQYSDKEPAATVLIHEGENSAQLGMSYVQFARQGLALQKTQIGANVRLAPAGVYDVGYTRYGSRTENPAENESSLFDGIDISVPGIASLSPDSGELRQRLMEIDQNSAKAAALFVAEHPDRCAPPLHDAIVTLDALIEQTQASALSSEQKFNVLHELRVKRAQFNQALLLALGVDVKVEARLPTASLTEMPSAVVGHMGSTRPELVEVGVRISSRAPISVRGIDFNRVPEPKPAAVPVSEVSEYTLTVAGEGAEDLSQPYFSRNDPEQPFYNISMPALRNAPGTPAPTINTLLGFDGVILQDSEVIQVAGHTLTFVPPVSLAISPRTAIFPLTKPTFSVAVEVSSQGREKADGTLRLALPAGWRSVPTSVPLHYEPDNLKGKSRNKIINFAVTPGNSTQASQYTLKAIATLETAPYSEGYRAVGYPGLTYTNFYTPSTYKAVVVDVTTAPNLRVAYLPGTGDDVPAFLPNLGVTPSLLSIADLLPAKLAGFDVLVLGVRAYAAHPELAGAGSKPLLDFAAHGGVVILQYMTARYGDAEAPYAISVPGDPAHNVVVEAQPVQILVPNSPLLTWPNKITSADFNNWAEERGHGFAASWGPQYQALLETHDPEQDPQKGGLLLAPVAKGAYIYCALALYRQLPEGVPGAYRLLANLLSYARNPHR